MRHVTTALAALAIILATSTAADARPVKGGPVNPCGDTVQSRLACAGIRR